MAVWSWCAAIGLIAGAVYAQTPLPGVESQPHEPTPEPQLTVDFEALLLEKQVLVDRDITGPVWRISPQPGRRLVQIPVLVTPLDGPSQLTVPSIDLRGGRFVAWVIPENEQEQNQQHREPQFQPAPPVGATRLGDIRHRTDLSRSGQGFDRPTAPVDAAAAMMALSLPEGTPRTTRKIDVLPDGQIRWELDRYIPGAEVTDDKQNYYALRLRPDRMQELRPERPRLQRGGNEDARTFMVKRREAEAEYRVKSQEYTEMRQQVMMLPDTFQTQAPKRLWAVYEMSMLVPELTLQGPAPLPWSIRFDEFEMIRRVAERPVSGQQALEGELQQQVLAMLAMAQRRQPAMDRMLAYTVAQARLGGIVQQGDHLYQLFHVLISSSDDEARRAAIQELATTIPPTTATIVLLKDAAQRMGPAMKLLTLRGLLQTDIKNAQMLQEALQTTNDMLRDPDGPDPGQILHELAVRVGNETEAIGPATKGIEFNRLSEDRLQAAVAAVAQDAATLPLAASWLNHRLLGANDFQVVRTTLEVIASASTGPSVVKPVANKLIGWMFGGSGNADAAPAPTTTGPIRLEQPIAIDSTSHNIYRVLNSGDAEIYQLAWAALPQFEITDGRDHRGRPMRRPTDPNAQGEADRYDLLVESGLARTPTPTQLTPFLARQSDPRRVSQVLTRIVIAGDSAASATAARQMLGSNWPLVEALDALDARDRAVFGRRFYEGIFGQTPQVAGLLGVSDDRSHQVVRWFGEQISKGQIPDAADWIESYNDEDKLLELAGSADPNVAAGAVGALVAGAGGSEQAAREMALRFSQESDRSVEGLRPRWSIAKREIFMRRAMDRAGSYRFVVQLKQSADGAFFDPGFGPAPMPGQAQPEQPAAGSSPKSDQDGPVVLGVIDLVVDVQGVRLSNQIVNVTVPESHFALRIDQPNELKNFQNQTIVDWPLGNVREPLDLLPQPDGSWKGEVRLMDGRTLEVRLEPAD